MGAMANSASKYLPALTDVLQGSTPLIPWNELSKILQETGLDALPNKYKEFLTDPAVRQLLDQPKPSVPGASEDSKKQFETITAAIHISSTDGEEFDVPSLKQDALWLSKELVMSEVHALRIVLLEWQLRPRAYLEVGYSETELASLREAFSDGVNDVNGSFEHTLSLRDDAEFSSETARRRREVFIYYQERSGFLTVLRLLAKTAALSESNELAHVRGSTLPDLSEHGIRWLQYLVETIQDYLRGPQWTVIDEDSVYLWHAGNLHQISILMELTLIWLRFSESGSSASVQQWAVVMTEIAFFAHVQPSVLLPLDQVQRLQLLAALVTIAFLDPAASIDKLNHNPSDSWLSDPNAVSDVHNLLFTAAEEEVPQASPVVLSWSLILNHVHQHATAAKDQRESHHVQRAVDQISTYDTATARRTSFAGSGQQSIFEDIMDAVMAGAPVPNPSTYLLTLCGTNGPEMIAEMVKFDDGRIDSLLNTIRSQVLQEVLSVSFDVMGYQEALLAAELALLEPHSILTGPNDGIVDPQATFIESKSLMTDVFEVAAARFPYESLSFLRLCKSLAQAKIYDDSSTQYVTFRLKALQSFAKLAEGEFEAFHTIREDENLNLVALDQSASLTPTRNFKMLTTGHDDHQSMIIPAETIGEVISEANPPVIRWHYEFCGLTLLGEWLQLHYQGQLYTAISHFEQPSDIASEIIGLLAMLLKTTTSNPGAVGTTAGEAADELLEMASYALPSGTDITQIIFDIMEQELQSYRRRPSNTFDPSTVTACFQYLAAMIRIRPDQFWSLIGKTSIVNPSGGESLVFSVISGVESFTTDLVLADAFVHLYREIVSNSLEQSLSNSPRMKKSSALNAGYAVLSPSRIFSPILEGFTYTALDVFQSLTLFSAANLARKTNTLAYLCGVFDQVLEYAYGFGDRSNPASKNAGFFSSAQAILDRLRFDEYSVDSKTSPLLQHLLPATTFRPSLIGWRIFDKVTCSLLGLSNSLVRCGQFLGLTTSNLEIGCLDALPLIIRHLHLSRSKGKIYPGFSLVTNLLAVVGSTKPISLLGHLGSASCISFIDLLKAMYSSNGTECGSNIFHLLVQLVSKKQQWLATVILTGTVPDKTNDQQRRGRNVHRGAAFMNVAFDLLSEIITLDTPLAAAVLEFVTQAQQNWTWTTSSIPSRANAITALVQHIPKVSEGTVSPIKQSQHNRIAALVTDLCAVQLHYAKSVRDLSMMKTIIPLLNWLTSHAIEVSSYNVSLHTNLHKNFSAKFGLDVTTFKNSGFTEAPFGEANYYLLDLANLVLSGDLAWTGNGKAEHQSFSAEMSRANTNLSVVESELKLLRSFQQLCVEHCGFFVQDQGVQRTMAHIVQNCLTANTRPYPPEALFDNVNQVRVDISMALIQRLVTAGAKGSDFRNLLSAAWDAATTRNGSYDLAITNDDLPYFRSLVSVILMALQFHIGKSWQPLSTDSSSTALLRHTEHSNSKILEIATVVVGQGFTSVAVGLQEQRQTEEGVRASDDSSRVGLRDIVLIVNTFETILRMARLPDFITQLSERLLSTNCIQASLALYSWSHILTGVDTDDNPVYAEYALQFLQSLSSLPLVAEELAVEGLLSRLLTARITQVMQKIVEGASPLDKRRQCQILYNLWADGLLPICLNLLHSVGAPIASEISLFLNQFPNQLKRAASVYAPNTLQVFNGFMTLSLAREAATLALISYVLDSYRSAGPSAAVDPLSILPLKGYDENRKALCEDIQDVINMKKDMMKSSIVTTNEKELQWNKTDALTTRILLELRSAVKCLQADENEENKT